MTDNTYWAHKGKHQDLYEILSETLVPASGPADTPAGELLRSMANVYYDVYNNGGCNNRQDALDGITKHSSAIKTLMQDTMDFDRFSNTLTVFNALEHEEEECSCSRPWMSDDEIEDCDECFGTGTLHIEAPSYLSAFYADDHIKRFYGYMDKVVDAVIEYVASQAGIDVIARAVTPH